MLETARSHGERCLGFSEMGFQACEGKLSYDGAGNRGAFHSYYSRGFIEQGFSARCLASSKRSGRGLFLGGGLTSEAAVPSAETSNARSSTTLGELENSG